MTSTPVVDLDHKLDGVVRYMRVESRKVLARHFRAGFHPANFNHWVKHQQVPDQHLQKMADWIRTSANWFATSDRSTFDAWLHELPRPAATRWAEVLRRQMGQQIITVVRVARKRVDRGAVPERLWNAAHARDEEYFIEDRVHVEIEMPWDFIKGLEWLHVLLLSSDDRGTLMVTAAQQPVKVARSQRKVAIPQRTKEPLVITGPVGKQSFIALLLEKPLDESLASKLPAPGRYLKDDSLEALAIYLLHRLKWQWWAACRQLYVNPSVRLLHPGG